jgi:16S rRNA (guanine527-N7)-methyltransferase
MPPNRASLQTIVEGCGIKLTPAQYDQLWEYHRRLRAANAELNLTRIHNFENMVLKHYVDSLLVLRFIELPSPLIDMGSGPGLPGIPLKIARPGVRMTLAEPRGARAEFLRSVCQGLKLDDVEVYDRKVGTRFPVKGAGVITRAVASIPETLDSVLNVLEAGGRMIFMKGPGCDDEITQARSSHSDSFRLIADHAYTIPGTTHARRLVIYERLTSAEAPLMKPDYAGPIRDITSDSNPLIKVCRDVLTGRGIRKHARAIVSGTRPIAEVLERFRDRAMAWITPTDGPPPPTSTTGLTWLRLTDPLFKPLDTAGTHAPLLLVTVPKFELWDPIAPWPTGCTLFVPFQDPENVGAVLRTAAAFGVSRAVLLREAAHPFHPKASRAAGPALFQIPLLQGPSIQDLQPSEAPYIALATDGDDITTIEFPDTFGLVPGVEGPGLPDQLRSAVRRRIAIAPGVESLNAATATAIALHEWRRQSRQSEL